MRMWVRSLALLSGLRIQRCRELWCSLQMWLRSLVAMAVASAGSYSSNSTPGLRTSMRPRCGPKKSKNKTNHKKKTKNTGQLFIVSLQSLPSWERHENNKTALLPENFLYAGFLLCFLFLLSFNLHGNPMK